MNKEELYVVNESGEIIDKIESSDRYVKLSEGDKVVRKGTLQYLSDTVDIKYHFIKVNDAIYGELANKYSILNILIKYVGYMDGILSFKNGKKLNFKNICQVCKVSDVTARKQLKGLMEDDVIHRIPGKGREVNYIMNPFVAFKGKKVYLSLYNEFKLSEYRNYCEECEK